MSYTKRINITQVPEGYQVTISQEIGEQSPEDIVLNFETEEELQAYAYGQIDIANLEEDVAQIELEKAQREGRAWFRELNELGLNDYYTDRRPKIAAWTALHSFRYRKPQTEEAPIDGNIDENGFLRDVEQFSNRPLRITYFTRRRFRAVIPGGNVAPFEMFSRDQKFWRGTDEEGTLHVIRIIPKKEQNDR